jgi:hypothetical protein
MDAGFSFSYPLQNIRQKLIVNVHVTKFHEHFSTALGVWFAAHDGCHFTYFHNVP